MPAPWRIRVQSAITTAESEPEPDLAVVRGPANRYAQRHPGPEDIAIVIEVADTSMAHDRTYKGRVFASARIPQYWIINLPQRCVEVYSEPGVRGGEPAYLREDICRPGHQIPVVLEAQALSAIQVDAVLPV